MTHNSDDSQVMTMQQVAAYLQFSEAKVYRLLNTGKIPGIKIGGQWRILRSALEGYMLRQSSNQPADPASQIEAYTSPDG